MKILVDINHPADVHQFRYIIKKLGEKHNILVVARNKECVFELLNHYKIPYIPRKGYEGFIGKILGILIIDLKLLFISLKFKPDILVGSSGDLYIAHVSRILGKPGIIFDDTEHSKIQNMLCFPFAAKVITPESYKLDLGKKQVRYPGSKENAYLSGKCFKADKNVLKKINIRKKEKLILLRLVSWKASHDVGKSGIKNPENLVKKLEKYGKVLISSERELPENLKKYELKIRPALLHSLIYYSDLVISEGGTLAVEAAVLGRAVIYANELRMGYSDELVKKGLILQITDENEILNKAKALLKKKKKRTLIKFDLNEFMIKEIEKCMR
ncbi:DUF354 domain-containing protein [Candidatus Woesearchaeota archaeon]|nr:DUF354 domain-containing protein [Candidatus Woesearchaeota archaeon]